MSEPTEPTEPKSVKDFLHAQMHTAKHRIERLQNALDVCGDCLEKDGLQAMLRNAQLEQELLQEPLQHNSHSADSLEAYLIEALEHSHEDLRRLSQSWQRGHPTPSAYWDTELRQVVLADLLGRLHAWQENRPLYPPVKAPQVPGIPS